MGTLLIILLVLFVLGGGGWGSSRCRSERRPRTSGASQAWVVHSSSDCLLDGEVVAPELGAASPSSLAPGVWMRWPPNTYQPSALIRMPAPVHRIQGTPDLDRDERLPCVRPVVTSRHVPFCTATLLHGDP